MITLQPSCQRADKVQMILNLVLDLQDTQVILEFQES